MAKSRKCTAFAGSQQVTSGRLEDVVLAIKTIAERNPTTSLLVFDDATGRTIDLDLRGTDEAAVQRLVSHAVYGSTAARPHGQRRPGRPKLGVVAREVTLLPRHWDWLSAQRGGASVTLRRLVDEARRTSHGRNRVRQAQEAAYRFMSAMAGNEPGYEEATRALFAGDRARYDALTGPWPNDIRIYAARLAQDAFAAPEPSR